MTGSRRRGFHSAPRTRAKVVGRGARSEGPPWQPPRDYPLPPCRREARSMERRSLRSPLNSTSVSLSQRVGRPRECAVRGRQSRPSAFSRLTIVFSAMVTPDRSTGVFTWGSVNVARTWAPGSSSQKNGLLCSARKVRTRGSIWGSLAAAGAPAAVWAITIVAPMRTMGSVLISLETLILALPLLRRSFMVLYRPVLILRPGRAGSRGVLYRWV